MRIRTLSTALAAFAVCLCGAPFTFAQETQPRAPSPDADSESGDAWAERWAHVHALARTGRPHVDLFTALSDDDAAVAALAGDLLARGTAPSVEQFVLVLGALRTAPRPLGAANAAAVHSDVDPEAAKQVFAELLGSDDRERRSAVADALGDVGADASPVIVLGLAELLASDDKGTRMRAAQILGYLEHAAAPAVDALCELASKGGAGWDVRAAARALGSTGVVSERVLATLDACTRSDVDWLRSFARDGLARIGLPAESVLLEMSARGDPKERQRTLSILGSACPTPRVVAHARSLLESKDMVDVLLGFALAETLAVNGQSLAEVLEPELESMVPQFRVGAANALLLSGASTERAGKVILEELAQTEDPQRMRGAFFALQGLAGRAPQTSIGLIGQLLDDESETSRGVAVHLISSLDGDVAAPLVGRVGLIARSDANSDIASQALFTLRGWGAAAQAAEAPIAEILASADEPSARRTSAASVLGGLPTLSPETLKLLERVAVGDDAEGRRAALRALWHRPASAEVLRAATQADDAVAATIAWGGLAALGSEDAECCTRVLSALRDADPVVRAAAAEGARFVASAAERADPSLVRLCRDPDWNVATAARASVAELYGVTVD